MKCKFCEQQAGFFKGYHEECKTSAENTMKQIEAIVNQHRTDEVVPKEVKLQIREIASSNVLYKNYVKSEVIDKTVIHANEVIIHVESMLRIFESRNQCKMVETGYRYDKRPIWSQEELLLDESGKLIFTDKAVYVYVGIKTLRYPYNKIVNYGYDKVFTLMYAYFDVKTASPFPHRFSFIDTFRAKNGRKEQNITLFLHGLG